MKKARIVRKVSWQRGKTNKSIDRLRPAKQPGVRISKSGKRYMETRSNRSDKNKKTRL